MRIVCLLALPDFDDSEMIQAHGMLENLESHIALILSAVIRQFPKQGGRVKLGSSEVDMSDKDDRAIRGCRHCTGG